MAVSVIGIGKLGAPFCAALALRDFNVLATDINPNLRAMIAKQKAPFFEAQLQDYLTRYGKRIKVVNTIQDAVLSSSVTFIVVATPSEKNGNFSLKYVAQALEEIGKALKQKKEFHIVVLVSTVLPLSSNKELIPKLEKISGKKCGRDFGYCYNPEFIALGSVIKNLLHPDFVLIGESDSKSGDILESFYKKFCVVQAKVVRMSIVNAEITKISLNSYITMKISFANFLAELCEKTPGANVDSVTQALGNDSRIGGKYLKGGLGFGGPCFPRDNRAITYFSEKVGVKSYLALATDVINSTQVERVAKKVRQLVASGTKVSILGLSYKPDTAVVEESQAVMIADALSKSYKVSVYDPAAMANGRKILGNKVDYASSIAVSIRGAKAIILATPWKEFDDFIKLHGEKLHSKSILIDCWRVNGEYQNIFSNNYFPLGYFKESKYD